MGFRNNVEFWEQAWDVVNEFLTHALCLPHHVLSNCKFYIGTVRGSQASERTGGVGFCARGRCAYYACAGSPILCGAERRSSSSGSLVADVLAGIHL